MTAPAPTPRFSVIVPTYNRVDSLGRTLASLEAQTLATDAFEVVVCDDGSTDGTPEFLAGRRGPRFTVVTQPNRGAAAARNAGIQVARGEFLAFTDDDCVVPPDWLESLERHFRETGADLVAGSADNILRSELSSFYQEMAHELYEARNRTEGRPEYLCTNNLACRSAVFQRIGPFDTRFFVGGEDRELAARLLARGGRIHLAADVRVRHAHVFTPGSFLRHFYRMGEGAYVLHRTLPRGADAPRRTAAPYLPFLARLLRNGPTPRALLRVGLFGMSQATMACAFAVQWARDARTPQDTRSSA